MKNYLAYLQKILETGENQDTERTGNGTRVIYQQQLRFDLNEGFPLVTTKSVGFKTVARELDWFLSGSDNITELVRNKVYIWSSDALRHNLDYIVNDQGLFTPKQVDAARADAKSGNIKPAQEMIKKFENELLTNEEFAQKAGSIGPGYGPQWRGMNGAEAKDQVQELEDALSAGGTSRRMLVSAWNSKQVPLTALPPCHLLYQAHVSPESRKLTIGWYQRSCDSVLGVPFNIASYALLTERLADAHGYAKGEVVGLLADAHIYMPHIPAAKEQIQREPKELPKHTFVKSHDSVFDYKESDSKIEGYNPHPKLDNPTPMYGGFF